MELNCTTADGGGFPSGVPCSDIPGEDQLDCTCPDCVRELIFVYTGVMCTAEEVGSCTQFGANPANATVMIGDALDANLTFFEGIVNFL